MALRLCASFRFNSLYSKCITPQRQLYNLNRTHYLHYSSEANKSTNTAAAKKNFLGDDTTLKTSSSSSVSKDEEPVVSDWIKDIQQTDDRPPIKYRRQDYPDPVRRTVGILYDDVRIFFTAIYNFSKELKKFVKGEHPYDRSGKKITDQKEIEQGDSQVAATSKTPEIPNDTEGADKNIIEKQRAANVADKKKQSNIKTLMSSMSTNEEAFPSHCDVLIVGGGAVGSSIAYHIKQMGTDTLSVVVVEKDPTYKESSTVLSVGGIRQQFSMPENILLSLYGMQFMRDMPRLLEVNGEPPPSVNFQPHGYLTLASEQGIQQLRENFYVQEHFKARVQYMEPSALRARFPFMNMEGIAGGVLGLENEGWFDPWTLLLALRRKAGSLGADYIQGEMIEAEMGGPDMDLYTDGHPSNSTKRVKSVKVALPNGEIRTITPALIVMAAGHSTGDICYEMMGIGQAKEGVMAYPVPIEPRKRYVYCFHAPKGPGLATPLVIDPTGAYFRREGLGSMFLGGMSPTEAEEPICKDLHVDHDYFTERVWPTLANRVPGFNEIKVQGSWAGYYEHNVFDQNGIMGLHPIVNNLIFAAGFSGHGIQHSLGVGRGISELLYSNTSTYKTIDLSRFDFERIILNEPVYEAGIV